MTQGQLAQQSGIPRPNLVALELGRRDCTLSTLERLAHGLGIRSEELLATRPQQPRVLCLSRHDREAVARYLITQQGKSPSRRFTRDLFPLIRPILEANGLDIRTKGSRYVRRYEYHLSLFYSRELVRDIVARVRKWVPLYRKELDQ